MSKIQQKSDAERGTRGTESGTVQGCKTVSSGQTPVRYRKIHNPHGASFSTERFHLFWFRNPGKMKRNNKLNKLNK